MKKTLLFIVTLLVTVLIYIQLGNIPDPIAADTASGRRLAHGPYRVTRDELTLIDKSRSTAASGDAPMSGTRHLNVSRWRPKNSGKAQPLVVYSHGFMSSRDDGTHLAEHLASHGYTFVAADFPLTSYKSSDHLKAGDVVNQPGDLSFLIDQLLRVNSDPEDPLFDTIDPHRIAAVGYSLGGLTTLLLGYHPELGDPRIKVAVGIAAPSQMLSERFFEHRKLPLLMIATPTDAMVSYQKNAENIAHKNNASWLVTIGEGSHAGFNYLSRPLRFLKNPDQIGCWSLQFAGDDEDSNDWYLTLGTQAQGITVGTEISACEMNPLPRTINPIRQQELTTLMVSSFLQCQLTMDVNLGAKHCNYLRHTAAVEIPEITVQPPQKPFTDVIGNTSY